MIKLVFIVVKLKIYYSTLLNIPSLDSVEIGLMGLKMITFKTAISSLGNGADRISR